MIVRRTVLLAALALLSTNALPASARRGRGRGRGHEDHEYADEALRSGEVLPLEHILAEIKKLYAGEVVGMEFDNRQGRWVYEVKMISPDGRYLEIYADAKTAEIIKVEGK